MKIIWYQFKNFYRLQLNAITKNGILLFLIIIPFFSFIILTSFVPIQYLAFVMIALYINVIGFFQFGVFNTALKDTTLEKNIILKSSSRVLKDINSIFFSLIISIIGSYSIIIFIFFCQLITINTGWNIASLSAGGPIVWKSIWWSTISVYIILSSLLTISIAYLVLSIISSKSHFFVIGVIYLFIMIISSGMYFSEFQIVYQVNEWTYIQNPNVKTTGWIATFHRIMPHYYVNQLGINAFRITTPDMDNLNPILLSNADWKLFVPIIATTFYFTLGNIITQLKI